MVGTGRCRICSIPTPPSSGCRTISAVMLRLLRRSEAGRCACGADAGQSRRALACLDARDSRTRSHGRKLLPKKPRDRAALPSVQEYYNALKPHCSQLEIWHTIYQHALDGPEAIVEWVKGTGLRPFIDPLPPEQRESFLARLYRADRRGLSGAMRRQGVAALPPPVHRRVPIGSPMTAVTAAPFVRTCILAGARGQGPLRSIVRRDRALSGNQAGREIGSRSARHSGHAALRFHAQGRSARALVSARHGDALGAADHRRVVRGDRRDRGGDADRCARARMDRRQRGDVGDRRICRSCRPARGSCLRRRRWWSRRRTRPAVSPARQSHST